MPSELDQGIAPGVAELATRLAKSRTFSRSRLHGPLLQFLASEATGGVKEVVVGHRFFDRPPDYDPKIDPVVRVEMRRCASGSTSITRARARATGGGFVFRRAAISSSWSRQIMR